MAWAFANGVQILVHANGDAATSDAIIEGVRLAEARHPEVDSRPVLIHGQTLRKDQVDALERLGDLPVPLPDAHLLLGRLAPGDPCGPERLPRTSRLPAGCSNAACASGRTTTRRWPSRLDARARRHGDPNHARGRRLGPDQRVDVVTALKAMTIWPAWQHFEEDAKGTLEVGKLADLVILSDNPTSS